MITKSTTSSPMAVKNRWFPMALLLLSGAVPHGTVASGWNKEIGLLGFREDELKLLLSVWTGLFSLDNNSCFYCLALILLFCWKPSTQRICVLVQRRAKDAGKGNCYCCFWLRQGCYCGMKMLLSVDRLKLCWY
ncbi:hypothetical protein NC651_005817 [Populus alba x Populus x berolinensis]|nr:hypothetical protein NC651_005817 [Populus alba x Populus x berolinensis]